MKLIFTTIYLIIFTSYGFSQQKGIVYYGQIESLRLKSPLGPDFNSFLVFDNDESYYVTANDSLENGKTFKKRFSSSDGQNIIAFQGSMTSYYGRQVYNSLKKDSIYWNQWSEFYVAEKTPKINWNLEDETKKIGNFNAHKATCKFRGRNYTAWYILEVPLPFGPWKLQGLPGLILEAYDADKEIYIYFKSLEYPTNNTVKISQVKRPVGHTKTWKTLDDFKARLDEIYDKMRNSSIIIAERMNSEVPEQAIKSEIFLESF
jgi:GLPGLI family protein